MRTIFPVVVPAQCTGKTVSQSAIFKEVPHQVIFLGEGEIVIPLAKTVKTPKI